MREEGSQAHEVATDNRAHGAGSATSSSLADIFSAGMSDPSHTAVVDHHTHLTYRELDTLAEHLAIRLRRQGARPGVRVGTTLDRSMSAIIAILGILRTGASYVPLDVNYPAERIRFMIEDAGVKLVVADPDDDLTNVAASIPNVRISSQTGELVDLDETAVDFGDVKRSSDEFRAPRGDDEAYVIYTSGSTGAPKGCSISHGNVASLLRSAIPLFDLSGQDRWSMFHSVSFDFSVWEMWGALSTGATIVVVSKDDAVDPQRIVDLYRQQSVTVVSAVPSVFTGIAAQLTAACPARYFVFGGEPVRMSDITRVADLIKDPAPRFVNMYGITESTVHATFKEIRAEDLHDSSNSSPIGVELPGLRIVVVDENGRPVANGADGEMLVEGDQVCNGYVNRAALTAERFVIIDGVRFYRSGDLGRRLANGELEHRGRVDDQVKIRGYRIELGELESALRMAPMIRDCCAVVLEASDGIRRLEVGVSSDSDIDIAALRDFLSTKLPPQFMPSKITAMTSIPRTPSGKTDRKLVAELLAQNLDPISGSQETRSIEDVVFGVWREVLGHSDFDRDAGFFDAGGDSLTIVVARNSLADEFPQANLRVVDLLIHSSVSALSGFLRTKLEQAEET